MNTPETVADPLVAPSLCRSAWRDFLSARRALFLFELLFKSLETWLLAPVVALVLATVLAGAGRVAVSNRDILDFVFTPLGMLYAALLAIVAAAFFLLEQAGIMVVAALGCSPERPLVTRMLSVSVRMSFRIAQLGAVKAVLLAFTFLPFVILAILTYLAFLTSHDIYFYITTRPPVFWVAACLGAAILVAASVVGTVLFVRWSFALPILLFENQSPRAALRASRQRVRGAEFRIGFALLGWQLLILLLGAISLAGFRFGAAALLDHFEDHRLVLVALLAAQGGLIATVSFAAVVGQGLLTRRLYLIRSRQLGIACPDGLNLAEGSGKPIPPWSWRLALLFLPIAFLAPVAVWLSLPLYVEAGLPVGVTAHRGHSRAAPENTLSALRKAIESGADYAELDAQLTADGVVVLLHDRDLKRVAGDSRRLTDLTYDQVKTMDVGRWFSPAFAGERIPTLAEAIDLARGRIKLNVELKLFGPDQGLARAVAELITKTDFTSDALVTSFDLDTLETVRQVNPKLRTGFIIAHAIGDASRLDVEVLNVRADHLSDELFRDARRRGREVHVWTINDPREMLRQIQRGVNNILTSDPDELIRVRNEWMSLTGQERLLLSSRLLLGLQP